MYLLESKIRKMQSRSKALLVWGWISSLFWSGGMIFSIVSEKSTSRRKDDFLIYLFVIFFFLFFSLLGFLKLFLSVRIRNQIKKARFINAYFENDLDGNIRSGELAAVMGEDARKAGRELLLLRRKCMTGFTVQTVGNEVLVELESKKVKCQCKNCGAVIDKKIYFAGTCPYCGSLDIFAQVITDNKVYSIQHVQKEPEPKEGTVAGANETTPSYFYITGYSDASSERHEFSRMALHGFAVFFLLILMGLALIDVIEGKEKPSLLLGFFLIMMPFIYNVYVHHKNVLYIVAARRFSNNAANAPKPMMAPSGLIVENIRKMITSHSSNKKQMTDEQKVSIFREMQKRGYLRHCSLMFMENKFVIGLAREIKKDTCPMCGAALIGTLSDHPTCKYCGYEINDAVQVKHGA